MKPVGRHLKLLCLLCLAVPAVAASGPGYLRIVGPAPLRFWSPTPHKATSVTTTNATPAIVSGQTDEPNPYDFLAAFGNNVNSAASAQGYQAQATSNPDQSNTALDLNPGAAAPQPGDVVSPQMLLKYFNKSTNGTGAGIIAPIDVNTSRPTQAQPSSATYSN